MVVLNINRFAYVLIVCLGLCGLPTRAHAQMRLQANAGMLTKPMHTSIPSFRPTAPLFPKYIQQNPMGYASLCRMELKIEKQLPVGVWMRADGATYRQVTNPGLAYLRFKIPISGSR
jgi:hypothetical protein